jgi:hypothetical protein
MPRKYASCPKCNKSNPVSEPRREEQTCIFCGQPFMISRKQETKLLSEPENVQNKMIRAVPDRKDLVDINQTKPVNKNKRKPLR